MIRVGTTFYSPLFFLNSWTIVYTMWLMESFRLLRFFTEHLLILHMHIPVLNLPPSSGKKSCLFLNIQLLYHFRNELSPSPPHRVKVIILYIKHTLFEHLRSISHKDVLYLALSLWWKIELYVHMFSIILKHILRHLWLPAIFCVFN